MTRNEMTTKGRSSEAYIENCHFILPEEDDCSRLAGVSLLFLERQSSSKLGHSASTHASKTLLSILQFSSVREELRSEAPKSRFANAAPKTKNDESPAYPPIVSLYLPFSSSSVVELLGLVIPKLVPWSNLPFSLTLCRLPEDR